MADHTDIPTCAGYWVDCVTCDGGANVETGEHEDACSWRTRCRKIQAHLIKLDTDPQAYTDRYGSDALQNLLDRIQKGEAGPKRKRKPKPKPKTRKKRKATPAQRRDKRYAKTKAMAVAFYETLADAVNGRNVVCCSRRTEAVRPGCIYLVDRTAKGVYINIYMRRGSGRAYKLAVLRLAPINGGLDVQLPTEECPENIPGDLSWNSWSDPPMKSVVRTLKTDAHYKWMAAHLAATSLAALKEVN